MKQKTQPIGTEGGLGRVRPAARLIPLLPRFRSFLYLNYRLSTAMHRWFGRRFTSAGALVGVMVLVTGGVGVDTNLALAYQAFTVLSASLGVAVLWSFLPKPSLTLQRVLPRFGTVGEALEYDVVVHNRGLRPENGLTLLEDLGEARPALDEFLTVSEPGEKQRNLFDRVFAYYRWTWLMRRHQRAVAKPVALPALAPRSGISVRCCVHPMRRGAIRCEGMIVGRPDPLGLFRGLKKVLLPQSVLVLPKRYPIPNFSLPGRMQYQRGGVALASSIGESEEFVGLREYRPGDPLRHIHWRSWAKTGVPIVKEFEDEFFVRHALILDTFAVGSADAQFEDAVSIAASFACAVESQDSLLDLMFVGPRAFCFTAGRGLGHLEQILEVLASVEICTEQPFLALERVVLGHVRNVSACICVLLEWDEQRERFVKQLQVSSVPVLVILICPEGQRAERERQLRSAGSAGIFHVIESGRVAEGLAQV